MATDLGKVGIVTKGNYNSANTYEVLDAVTYQGGLYLAKQAVPAGTLPSNTTYWQKAVDATNLLSAVEYRIDVAETTTIGAKNYDKDVTVAGRTPLGIVAVQLGNINRDKVTLTQFLIYNPSAGVDAAVITLNYNSVFTITGGVIIFKVLYI